ncbi:MAG: permease-like cell division protein FtsX [Eubacteriales bacterium]
MRISYSIKQSFKNMLKNRLLTIASISTIAACLFIFGLFYTVLTNFQYAVNQFNDVVGLQVFFKEDITQDEIDYIGREISKRPELKSIEYISPEEAWERWKADHPQYEEILQGYDDDNPFEESASYKIFLEDLSKQKDFVVYVEKIPGVRHIYHSDIAADTLTNMNTFIAYISLVIFVILIFVALFLISNTVRISITMRKDEIKIMKLIGATDKFVRRPFVFEGIIIGLVGSIIPLSIIYFFYDRVINNIRTNYPLLRDILVFLDLHDIFAVLLPICLGIGVGIGMLGSRWTLRKHLNV